MPRLLTILAIIFSLNAVAQVEFTANAPATVAVDEQFRVVFKVNAEADNFQPPSFPDFQIVGGPSPSYSRRQINTKVFYEISYTYVLLPKKTGSFTIGSASIEVDGRVYRTEPININVKKSSTGSDSGPAGMASKNVDLQVLVSKKEVYPGEPVVATYKLYFKEQVGNYSMKEEPDFTGFYTENVEIPVKRIKQERINGEVVNTAVLAQKVLVPQQTGDLSPGTVHMSIPTVAYVTRNNIWGRRVRVQQVIDVPLRAEVPTIKVRPLPADGRPTNFSGAVGSFDLKVSVSRDALEANESLNLKIKVSGRGNVQFLEMPEPELPKAFEVYDPRVTEDIDVNAGGMSGTKTAEYLLVPRYGGDYKIPALQFSYFDPQTRRYRTLKSESFTIKVEGAARPDNAAIGGVNKEAVDFLNRDILFIKTKAGELEKRDRPFMGSTVFFILLGILLVLPMLMILYFILVVRRKPDFARKRKDKAGKVARKQLKQAHQKLESGEKEEFYQALNTALWGYFADRFHIARSKMSKDTIRENLRLHHVDEPTIDAVMDVMHRAEMARYTSLAASDARNDYNEVVDLISKIEKSL